MKTLFLILILTFGAAARCDTTTIYGKVLSPDHINVRNARVFAVPQHGGTTYSTYSNAFGYYSLRVPICDNYAASVTYRTWSWPVYIVFEIENPRPQELDFVGH